MDPQDGTWEKDGTYWPHPNLDIPEIQILSDSEESIWGMTDETQHDPTFIMNERRNRRIEENLDRLSRAERRNNTREQRLTNTLRQIRILHEEGNEADDSRYNWEFHNDRMADLSIMRDNLVRQIALYRVRRQRNEDTRDF